MSLGGAVSPLPHAGKKDLWKAAYEIIRHDPDDSTVYASFREILNAERGRGSDARLSSESGRKELLSLIDQRRDRLAAQQTSAKVQKVFTIADKVRNIVTLGASANPIATAAVAGLFVAFDVHKMYTDAAQAMLDIAIDTAGAICRAGVGSREVFQQESDEPQYVLTLRDELRGNYVQLYRTILLLTMRLVRTLSSKTKTLFAGWSDWPAEHQTLQKMEGRVNSSLVTISQWRLNMPKQPPNWNIQGRNELHNAARYGQTNEVFSLIKHGKCGPAILNGQSRRGWTALMFAAENGHYDIMDMLLECKGIDVNIQNATGWSALYMASYKNRPAMVRRLLRAGAEADVRDLRGITPWLMIAMAGYLDCMKALRKDGADLNQTSAKSGYSALHSAVEGNQLAVVQWLLQQGIDTSIRMTGGPLAGMTAREQASGLGHEEILKALS